MEAMMGYSVAFMIVFLLVYFLILAAVIVQYVLQSLALYTIADRRGLPNPWLAWIPVALYWVVGGIVDDYEATRGMRRKWRVVLLVLALVMMASVVLMYVFFFIMMFTVMSESMSYDFNETAIVGQVLLMYVFLIPMAMAASALQACYIVCLYKVFESTVPEKAVKYLVLGMLVPLALGICLFKARKQGYERPKVWYYMPAPVPVPVQAPAAEAVPAPDAEPAAEPVPPEMTAAPEETAEPETVPAEAPAAELPAQEEQPAPESNTEE